MDMHRLDVSIKVAPKMEIVHTIIRSDHDVSYFQSSVNQMLIGLVEQGHKLLHVKTDTAAGHSYANLTCTVFYLPKEETKGAKPK